FLPVFQGGGAFNSFAIDARAIRGLEIANEPAVVLESDLCVPPRHVFVVEHDRAIQTPAQGRRLFRIEITDVRPAFAFFDFYVCSHEFGESPAGERSIASKVTDYSPAVQGPGVHFNPTLIVPLDFQVYRDWKRKWKMEDRKSETGGNRENRG